MLSFRCLPWWFLTLVRLSTSSSSFSELPLSSQVIAANAYCNSTPTGPIEITLCDYESIESVNDRLFDGLKQLVHTPFFKYFQVDLYRECPYWREDGMCMSRECGITTVDESQIPEKWRAATLSKLEPPSEQRIALPGCYYRDSDFCFLDDHTEGDYFDLSLVPERYTGYSGAPAHNVWRSIYDENCFGLSEHDLSNKEDPHAVLSVPDTIGGSGGKLGESEEVCLEKKVYYKIISGLHASISTHVCREYLDQTTGIWAPSLTCFISRVASHPERLHSIYFNTVLLLRAVARIGPYLRAYDYCSTRTHEEDVETLKKLESVIGAASEAGRFDERGMFTGADAQQLKEEFKVHFRNISRIMDCVECDKCRLWGKVQVTGLGTALKILFELDEKALDPHTNPNLFQRSEVVALIQTLYRFSESLKAYESFRKMWKEASGKPNLGLDNDSFGRAREEWLAMPMRWMQEAEGVMRDGWGRLTKVFKGSGKEMGPGRVEL